MLHIFAIMSEGFAEGCQRETTPLPGIGSPGADFLPFLGAKGRSVVLSGRVWQARRLRHEARTRAKRVRQNRHTSRICLDYSQILLVGNASLRILGHSGV